MFLGQGMCKSRPEGAVATAFYTVVLYLMFVCLQYGPCFMSPFGAQNFDMALRLWQICVSLL